MVKKYYLERTNIEDARDIIFRTLKEVLTEEKLGTEVIPVQEANGRILAQSLRAIIPVPREYISAMDGIATRAEYTERASFANPVKIPKDKFIVVNTGNVIPLPFDCVIRREDYWEEGEYVVVRKPHQKYENVRIPGEDVLPFDLVAEKWKRVDGKIIALCLQSGIREVKVFKSIKAVFLPTGSELLPLSSKLEPGKVYETNSYIFLDYLRELGLEVFLHPTVEDDEAKLEDVFEELSLKYHLVFVCGGTSAGEYDYTTSLLRKKGKLLIHGLNIRPGKPFVFGLLNGTPIFGLPGYPGAGIFNFEEVVLPPLKDFFGETRGDGVITAKVGKKIQASEGEDHFFHVVCSKVGSNYWFYPIKQGSGPLSPFIHRTGYVKVERGLEGVEEGQEKEVYLSINKSLVSRGILFVGSHDLSLDIIKEILWEEYRIPLYIVNVGSLGGIMAIWRGRAHFSGIHLLDEESGEYNLPYLRKYGLKDFLLFPFLLRSQGFVVRKGMEVKSFREIRDKGLVFVSRQRGSGTRILSDFLLKKEGLGPSDIKGYENEVITHVEVGHFVREGLADVGMAIKPTASLFDLDFYEVALEKYDLLFSRDFLSDERFQLLKGTILSQRFKDALDIYGGYRLIFTGEPEIEG